MKKIISTAEAPAAIGPYSQAVRAGSMVFCAGQVPLDPKSGQIVSENIAEQTKRVLDSVTAILKAENLTLANVVKTTVFLADFGDFQKMNEVYATYFTENPPARSTGRGFDPAEKCPRRNRSDRFRRQQLVRR
jgi:endoribonuclease L-PSP, putative